MTIFEYTDYRIFLRDFILERKRESPSYSFRNVAYRLGCNPGFFNRVIKGERNLNPEHTLKLCEILKLPKKEKKYFELLVGFNQAKKQLEREHFFEQLKGFKDSKIKRIGESQYSLYDEWFNIVLRELLNVIPCHDVSESTCSALSNYMTPAVKSADIRNSISKLLELGIVVKDSTGRFRLSDKLISTGLDIPAVIVQKILRQFFELGLESLDRFKKQERVCSTVTVSVSRNGYEQIKTRLEQYRKELLEIAHADQDKLDRVYHVNIQLFPVTKPLPEHIL